MLNKYLKFSLFAGLTALVVFTAQSAKSGPDAASIQLPQGFKLSVFANESTKNGKLLNTVRFIAFDAKGHMLVSNAKSGKILQVIDANHDGVAEEVRAVAEGLNSPQGMVFVDDALLVANQDGVVKIEGLDLAAAKPAAVKISPFIPNLSMGWHTLKTIRLSPDGYLYINVGSSCNVCLENDATRATILRYTKEGKPAGALVTLGRHQPSAIWARGLRNSQDFAWHPVSGEMFATNNGSDMRSSTKNGAADENLPPEHLNKIEAGKHYGWPYCWGKAPDGVGQVQDPNFVGEAGFCKTTQAPAITFTSHTTPIGLTFLNKAQFPKQYQNDAIVALHGSWNRENPAGYQLVRVKFNAENQPETVEDFATGWLVGKKAWGRPVDVAVGTDGALYVSDDLQGAIYRITY